MDLRKPHGIGRAIFKDKVQEGQFEGSHLEGFGREIHENGEVLMGWFRVGKLQGYGKKFYPDGKVEVGLWELG